MGSKTIGALNVMLTGNASQLTSTLNTGKKEVDAFETAVESRIKSSEKRMESAARAANIANEANLRMFGKSTEQLNAAKAAGGAQGAATGDGFLKQLKAKFGEDSTLGLGFKTLLGAGAIGGVAMGLERIFKAATAMSKTLDGWATGAKSFGAALKDAWSNVPVLGAASDFGREVGGSDWIRRLGFWMRGRDWEKEMSDRNASADAKNQRTSQSAARDRLFAAAGEFDGPTDLSKMRDKLKQAQADYGFAYNGQMAVNSPAGRQAFNTIRLLRQAIAEEQVRVALESNAKMVPMEVRGMFGDLSDMTLTMSTEGKALADKARKRIADDAARSLQAAEDEQARMNADYDAALQRTQDRYDRDTEIKSARRDLRDMAASQTYSRPELVMGAAELARAAYGGPRPGADPVPTRQLEELRKMANTMTSVEQNTRNQIQVVSMR